MGERRHGILRYARALSGTAALALLCALGAFVVADREDRDPAPFQRVLDRQAAALRAGDERGFLDAVDPQAPRHRGAQRQVFHNLRRLPLSTWAYEVREVAAPQRGGGSGGSAGSGTAEGNAEGSAQGDTVTVEAVLRYRLADFDQVTTTATERFRFVRRDGGWRIADEASGSDSQLWEQGTMTVVRGAHSLVLGVGRDRAELRALADAADRAVPAVAGTWPDGWSRRTVLEAPASVRQMARLLGTPAADSGTYAGIAAVTTGEAGGASRAGGGRAPADRIVVNPSAYGLLSEEGRQVVLTHETTHVATRRQTTSATPLWLSEGIADWAGYRRSRLAPREAAPELARALAGRTADGGTAPALRALPADADFRFGNDPAGLARAYEGGWLACRMVAEEWGSEKLLALYARAGRAHGGGRPDADAALRSVLGVGKEEFTERWRAYTIRVLEP
ncbi:hypothetical protein [Streptomyces qinglanensis]|uniref:hypothetical protein n=1 Tax=Streptomyces qinglanensis TaxID=943816 RepID=UPI003D740A14